MSAAAPPTVAGLGLRLTKYLDWMKKYPAGSHRHDLRRSRSGAGAGQIAQQIFWYTAFTADMVKAGMPVVNADGTPKWRMAPVPNGPYWKQGMQNGYQDVGSWTFFETTPARPRRPGSHAQFITAKTTR